jgi:hypothetical protein
MGATLTAIVGFEGAKEKKLAFPRPMEYNLVEKTRKGVYP